MLAPDTIIPETLRVENADCTLLVTVSQPAPDALRLHYQVHNLAARPLYLLNQLWQDIARDAANRQIFQVLPNLANVQVHPEHVTVGKAVVDVPYLKLVEVRHIPCLTQVAPGADYAETVDLALPLVPYTVYQATPARGPVVVRSMCFELGYLLGLPDVESAMRVVVTPTGTAFYTNPFPASDQSLIGVGPFQAAVPVATRPDELPPPPASNGEWTPWS